MSNRGITSRSSDAQPSTLLSRLSSTASCTSTLLSGVVGNGREHHPEDIVRVRHAMRYDRRQDVEAEAEYGEDGSLTLKRMKWGAIY